MGHGERTVKKKFKKREPLIALVNIFQDRVLRSYSARRGFAALIRWMLGLYGYTASGTQLADALRKHKVELERDGITVMPDLEPCMLNEVIEHCSTASLVNPWHREHGSFELATRPAGTKTAKLVEPLKCPWVRELVYDESVLSLMLAVFKCKYVIDSVDIWWSFPTFEDAQEAENYHRDTDSAEFFKRFIYITDVDSDSGPTTFVPGSHLTSDFYSGARFSDSDVESKYKGPLAITGPAGTNFIANTLGLHKGQKPKSGMRLLMQFRYSLHGSSFRNRELKLISSPTWVARYAYNDYLAD